MNLTGGEVYHASDRTGVWGIDRAAINPMEHCRMRFLGRQSTDCLENYFLTETGKELSAYIYASRRRDRIDRYLFLPAPV